MKKPRILVVGSLVMDMIVSTSRFPNAGETVIGCGFRTATGGKGANQAVQAARLEAEVIMVGRVGRDGFGEELIDSLRRAGVDVTHLMQTNAAPSAIGNVQLEMADDHTANRIVVVPGANMCVTQEDVAFLREEIGRYDMVVLQMEIPMSVNEAVIRMAYDKQVPVMLNPAPYAPLAPEYLSMVTYISPNEHEAALMTGVHIRSNDDAREAMACIKKSGVKNVIITLGSRGACFYDGTEYQFSPCVEGIEVQDPTAAGDSFVGAFCTAICHDMGPWQAMEFANHAAALTVSRMGAQPSLPTLAEVKALMEKRLN